MLVFGGVRRLAAWRQAKRELGPARPRELVGVGPTASGAGHGHRPVTNRAGEASAWGRSGALTSMTVGALHGVGAETPTQVLLLAAAATAGGVGPGLLLLAAFLLGLFLSNGLVGVTVAFGFLGASRNFAVYATVSVLTGIGGMTVGALLLTGSSNLLPALFAG